ncbi:MAG: amino acid permease [Rhodothermaceae bacterium]
MRKMKQQKKMKKELRLFDVYAIATGTTLSAGFFLLPGIAASQAGPAIILAYILAAIPLIPATLSKVELATAMPKAGGVYYFLDRTLGPVFGTIGGIGTWIALILKVAFALVGMGAYLELFFPFLPILPISIAFALILGFVNLFGTKKSGHFQIILVSILMFILFIFIGGGLPEINPQNFNNFFSSGFSSLLATTGLVYVSYVGITKVISLSEEVVNPEKTLPRGIFLGLGTAFLIYALGTIIMVGVIPMDELAGNLTPVAAAAEKFFGKPGTVLVSFAAMLAFISVANAGIMSASRYPLAMSRDHLFSRKFQKLGKFGTPFLSILTTVSIIVLILIVFDPAKIAKLASAFQLLLFAMICLSVIVMRESKIASYDPGYKSPFYPWTQILGILSSVVLIVEMGWLPSLFSSLLIVIGVGWYWYYAKGKIMRTGAIYHVFERLGQSRNMKLDSELREILKEKGLRAEDPFDEIVASSHVIDLLDNFKFEEVVREVAEYLTNLIPFDEVEIFEFFMEGTRIGATPVTHGVALPHFRSDKVERTQLVLVRCTPGVKIVTHDPLTHEEESEEIVQALFFLVSPEKDPAQHLRMLANIAGKVDEKAFHKEFFSARDEQEIKEALIHDERVVSLRVSLSSATAVMVERELREIRLPQGCLITWLRRGSRVIIPKGNTILLDGDRLTIIGDNEALAELNKMFDLQQKRKDEKVHI